MRYTVAVLLVLVLSAVPALGQNEAVIESTSGKVEIRSEGGQWQAASEGQTIALGTTVSTGFEGRATLRLRESELSVEPLTRLTVRELIRESDTVKTRTSMEVGEVEADVQSAEGLKSDFEVRSPEATASVRGTQFQFDGTRVTVREGTVSLQNRTGVGTTVAQNQSSSASGSAPPSDPESETTEQFNVSANTSPAAEEDGGGEEAAPEPPDPTASVYVEVEW